MTREELQAKLSELEAQKSAIEIETRTAIEAAGKAAQACRELSAKGFHIKTEIARTKREIADLPVEPPVETSPSA